MAADLVERHRCEGGWVSRWRHDSASTRTPMTFSLFEPPGVGPFPAVVYLATFMAKGGALRHAAGLGLMLVAPDTSPRGLDLPGLKDSWDFGEAAGFYLDATQAPWQDNFRMESYLTQDLLPLLAASFPLDPARLGLMGHSMGGHGALTLGLKHPALFRSMSALAPVAAPSQSPWGQKAWRRHDTVSLLEDGYRGPSWLVDQGEDDPFLASQLRADLLQRACAAAGQPLTYRRHAGYDHGYYFIQTVIDDHLDHHAAALT
jgi:S-formylglutathione hydrolase